MISGGGNVFQGFCLSKARVRPWETLLIDLVAYYELEDDASNTFVKDSAGNFNGTANRNTDLLSTSGIIGKALEFPAAADNVLINTGNLQHEYVSLSCWVNTDSLVQFTNLIDGARGITSFILRVDNNRLSFFIFSGGSFRSVVDPSNFPLSEWVHCAATYDGSVQKLYVNGEQVATNNHTGTLDAFDLRMLAKDPNNTTRSLPGKMDEVGIWSRALTESEVKTLYNNGNGLPYPD